MANPSHPVPGDTRYEIELEWCGHPVRHHVLRWCGDFINSSPCYAPMVDAAHEHAAAREDAMDQEFAT